MQIGSVQNILSESALYSWLTVSILDPKTVRVTQAMIISKLNMQTYINLLFFRSLPRR